MRGIQRCLGYPNYWVNVQTHTHTHVGILKSSNLRSSTFPRRKDPGGSMEEMDRSEKGKGSKYKWVVTR